MGFGQYIQKIFCRHFRPTNPLAKYFPFATLHAPANRRREFQANIFSQLIQGKIFPLCRPHPLRQNIFSLPHGLGGQALGFGQYIQKKYFAVISTQQTPQQNIFSLPPFLIKAKYFFSAARAWRRKFGPRAINSIKYFAVISTQQPPQQNLFRKNF